MNIFQINAICRDNLSVLEYLQDKNILHKDVECIPCQRQYSLIKESAKLSGYVWRCPGCRIKQSVLKDSFIEGSKISPTKFMYLVYYWSTETPLQTTMQHLDISSHTGVDYYQYLRDVCSWKLLAEPIQLGGSGKEVQIDESLLVKAKYFRGRNLKHQDRWIFGAYDVDAKHGFITFVTKRDAATLLPIIERVIAPESIIISDEWAAYRNIPNLPNNYRHQTVNHSKNFVNPATGAHTNNVENYWKRAKSIFKRMNGTQKEMIPSYLDEFMWRERYGQTFDLSYLNIMSHISEFKPC